MTHRLGQWGMTVGEFDPLQPNFQWPTILECDLVMMDSATVKSINLEQSAADGESFAPLILLGVSGSLLLARDAWQVLPHPNPDSKSLRLAVQTCLEQGALMRHGPAAGQDREDFLTFLGHEMRSPLTAAKTALEVLQGDLGGIGSSYNSADPNLKMLEIALRNVRRLHHTVEWSQELLASSPLDKNILLQDVSVLELQEVLGKFSLANWQPVPKKLCVHTHCESLSMLVDQVVRALQYAVPHCQPELDIGLSQKTPGALSLTLSPARGGVQDGAPSISRLGLASSAAQGISPMSDLEQLVRFVVSPVLVSRLGIVLEVVSTEGEEPAIRILVPAAIPSSEEQQSVVQLLTPA